MPSEEIIDVTAVDVNEPKKSWRKPAILIAAPIAAFLAAAAGGYYYFTRDDAAHEEPKAAEAASSAYVEVPPMVVNLRSGGGDARFLKLRFIVVAANESEAGVVKDKLPVLLDVLQPFLRELRPDDLDGSAAVFRIKEEMLRRARAAYGKGKVTDILIQDLVQQ